MVGGIVYTDGLDGLEFIGMPSGARFVSVSWFWVVFDGKVI
jgi:hypothetical protein